MHSSAARRVVGSVTAISSVWVARGDRREGLFIRGERKKVCAAPWLKGAARRLEAWRNGRGQ
jgi:hypothetical protein